MSDGIHLGFSIGPRTREVVIPLRHMAVTGQTQESGKTTTLEALVARSGRKAIAFVTKRGERAFADARRIAPYFHERADWQFVDALLEAQLREKNKFLRPWVIRICRTTRTLADVHAAVREALKKARGVSEGVYTQLDAYLDLIVPEIARAELAPTIDLQPGLNVMDLSGFNTAMQMLFVQSAIDWVNTREDGVTVIVPEAWEFIPQGKGSPVKASAESLIRKGAGLGNYLWTDAQDMAGVDNVVLRGSPVWLIGVQREANEIRRNLANIPADIARPTASEIARLGIGEFFACWGQTCIRTYVQPAWMDADEARAVARGERTVSRRPAPPSRRANALPVAWFDPPRAAAPEPQPPMMENPSMCQEHGRLADEVARLTKLTETLREDVRGTTTRNLRQHEQLEATRQLVDAFRKLGLGGGETVAGELAGAPFDEEALVQRVLARIPAGGAPIMVTPPAKLRADFQREEVDRILARVAALSPLAKRVLKLLEALEGSRLFQKTIAERLGRATRGGSVIDLGVAVKSLAEIGLVDVDPKNGVRAACRDAIASDLAAYKPAEADVEATYQAVLHTIATAAD